MQVRYSHTALQVSNVENSIEFYCNKLGLQEYFRLYNPDGSLWIVYLRCADGRFIEIFPGEIRVPYSKFGSFQHICFEVDDLATYGNELIAKGIDLYLGPTYLGKKSEVPYRADFTGKCGSHAFYVKDPDGNEVEVMQYTPLSLQTKTLEELEALRPKIESNEYIPEAKWQGGK